MTADQLETGAEPPHAACATSVEDMVMLGGKAAAGVSPGTVIALVGGLGAGKTHWTKGFVTAMGAAVEVTSPTFSLVHEYRGGTLPVFHFDFYRLAAATELLAMGWDEYLDEGGVVIAEWADKFPELLPPDTHWLEFTVAADGTRSVAKRGGPP
jgi:tRNA threonylcarbamoyladenosine biosynthesis protein TsaE